mgnify:FL=1
MKNKQCRKCLEVKDIDNFTHQPRNKNGLNSYCKTCTSEVAKASKLKHKTERWHQDGFESEKEHFNHALAQYAEVFNCPQLLKYIK